MDPGMLELPLVVRVVMILLILHFVEVTTIPWFNAGGSSPTSLSLVAPAWAETDGTLAANSCDTNSKTPRGSCHAIKATGYNNYLCILLINRYGYATYPDQLTFLTHAAMTPCVI